MAKYGTPPLFHLKFFFTKMTQNGLKWILSTTLKSVTFGRRDLPPNGNIWYTFFEGFPFTYVHIIQGVSKKTPVCV